MMDSTYLTGNFILLKELMPLLAIERDFWIKNKTYINTLKIYYLIGVCMSSTHQVPYTLYSRTLSA